MFLYLRDPLFICSICLFWVNHFLIRPNVSDAFFHCYFNDLLCVSITVPIVTCLARMFGFRPDDRPPQINEALLPLLVWYLTAQAFFPQLRTLSEWTINDRYDVLWYCVGAGVSMLWWSCAYMQMPKSLTALAKLR